MIKLYKEIKTVCAKGQGHKIACCFKTAQDFDTNKSMNSMVGTMRDRYERRKGLDYNVYMSDPFSCKL